MSTLKDMFWKMKIPLFQNESLDLDHYYQEPYQDSDDDNPDQYEMGDPFESITTKQKRKVPYVRDNMSNFCYFMDGSRRTYKIGDIVLNKTKIYPVVVAQVRAGCCHRDEDRKVCKHLLEQKNLLLVTHVINDIDFQEFKLRIPLGVYQGGKYDIIASQPERESA